jgi:hypothetical protein
VPRWARQPRRQPPRLYLRRRLLHLRRPL